MISNSELILLFKKESGMSETEWKKFCRRYKDDDISTVVEALRVVYAEKFKFSSVTLREHLKEYLKTAMQSV